MGYKLFKIDALTRGDHSFLNDSDACYHLMVYHPRKGYAYGPENDLLQNFKKPMDRKDRPEWRYKLRAIQRIGLILSEVLENYDLDDVTIVPIPPSKIQTDPMHDNRLQKVLTILNRTYENELDIRELLYLKENYTPSHESPDGERLKPEDVIELYAIDKSLCKPKPKMIILFDDMITAGAHYVGCRNLLAEKFPSARIIGIFVFRRVPET
jgi:hypothetical protein